MLRGQCENCDTRHFMGHTLRQHTSVHAFFNSCQQVIRLLSKSVLLACIFTATLQVQGHRRSGCSIPSDEGAGILAAQGNPGALRGAVQEAQGRVGHGAVR